MARMKESHDVRMKFERLKSWEQDKYRLSQLFYYILDVYPTLNPETGYWEISFECGEGMIDVRYEYYYQPIDKQWFMTKYDFDTELYVCQMKPVTELEIRANLSEF